jgi:uncharacterized protein YjeT (DUF2065 family)
MTDSLLLALGLMLVIEGIVPFIAPAAWRETFARLIQLQDGQIRFIGLTALVVGLILIVVLT